MINHKRPKFYWILKIIFPSAKWNEGVIITFKPWIFCKFDLTDSLIAHEQTHIRQQSNPYVWWIKYIIFPRFRLLQEIEAHRNEYNAVRGNRNQKYKQLNIIADRLSSKLYKNLISKDEAIKIILNETRGKL